MLCCCWHLSLQNKAPCEEGIEPTNDGLKPSAITILAIRSIAVGAFCFGKCFDFALQEHERFWLQGRAFKAYCTAFDAFHKTPLFYQT